MVAFWWICAASKWSSGESLHEGSIDSVFPLFGRLGKTSMTRRAPFEAVSSMYVSIGNFDYVRQCGKNRTVWKEDGLSCSFVQLDFLFVNEPPRLIWP